MDLCKLMQQSLFFSEKSNNQWESSQKGCGGKVFSANKFFIQTTNWADAHKECEIEGGFLAEPKTKELSDLLVSKLLASLELRMTRLSPQASIAFVEGDLSSASAWWIGLTDWSHEDIWVWEHSVEEATITSWASGAPNTGSNSDDCVMMAREDDFLWRDTHCLDTMASIICQK